MDKAPPRWDDCQSSIGCEPADRVVRAEQGGAVDCELRGSQASAPQAGFFARSGAAKEHRPSASSVTSVSLEE